MSPTTHDLEEVAYLPAYLFLAAILALHVTIGSFVQVANPAFGIAFDELFVFAGITALFVRARNFRPAPFLGLRMPRPGVWLPTIGAASAGFFAAGAINALNRLLVGPEISARFDVTRLFETRSSGESLLLVVGVTVLAPLGEELLFRGYLMRVMGARYGSALAVLITSVLFALFHFNPASVIALFALGVVFGLLRVWTGSIVPSMLAHAIQNGVASAMVLSGMAEQSPDELPAGDALLLLLIAAPFLFGALLLLHRRRSPSMNEEELPAIDPEAGHRFDLSLAWKPFLAGASAAIAALALLFAVDGEAASARLRRSPPPPERSPGEAPSEGLPTEERPPP